MLYLIVGRTDNTILFPKTELEIIIFVIQTSQSILGGVFLVCFLFCFVFFTAVLIVLNSVNMFIYFLLFTSGLCPYKFSMLQG